MIYKSKTKQKEGKEEKKIKENKTELVKDKIK